MFEDPDTFSAFLQYAELTLAASALLFAVIALVLHRTRQRFKLLFVFGLLFWVFAEYADMYTSVFQTGAGLHAYFVEMFMLLGAVFIGMALCHIRHIKKETA